MNRRTVLLRGLPLGLLLPLLAAIATADPPDEGDPEGTSSEAQKLHGTWRVVRLVRDGKEARPDEVDNMRLIFGETEYTYKNQQGKRMVGTFKVRPSRKPPVLETIYAEPPAEGKAVARIYQWVDKDTLKLCSPGPDERVPDNFEAPQGSGREMAVWKRIDE